MNNNTPLETESSVNDKLGRFASPRETALLYDGQAIDCLILFGSVPAVHAHDVLELFKETFGNDIVRDIVAFCDKHSEKHPTEVRTTMAHDIGGALRRDTLMLPRVTGAYSNSE
jgi:hypothetical protein